MTYNDPPAPVPLQPGETAPVPGASELVGGQGQAAGWVFNPEYQKLIDLWLRVHPLMEQLTQTLDRPFQMARSQDVWDAPVAERYVRDLDEWRSRLARYRQAVLTAISDQAAETPRWVPRSVLGFPDVY